MRAALTMEVSIMIGRQHIRRKRARRGLRRVVVAAAAHFRTCSTKMILNRKKKFTCYENIREFSNSESDNSSIIFRD